MRKVVTIPELARRIGESHHRAKLTDHDVDLILALADGGMSYAQIAQKFEVSKSCVQHVVSGRNRSRRTVSIVCLKTTTDRGDRS
jgi:hypothetical protein